MEEAKEFTGSQIVASVIKISTIEDDSDFQEVERCDGDGSTLKKRRVSIVPALVTGGDMDRFGKHFRDADMAHVDQGRKRLYF